MKRHDVQIKATHTCSQCGHVDEPTQMMVAILTDGVVNSTSNTVDIDTQGEVVEPQKKNKFLGNGGFPEKVVVQMERESRKEQN